MNKNKYKLNNLSKKYLADFPLIYKTKSKNTQEAHEAIRVIDPLLTPTILINYLELEQFKLYDLIWRRTIACQMQSAVVNTTNVIINSENQKHSFRSTQSFIIFDGFYKIYKQNLQKNEDLVEKNALSYLFQNEKIKTIEINPNQHFTEPPSRYTEASLVKKLEELGIGRPSTYATIISVLKDRNYVKLVNKRFVPENRGLLVIAFLVNSFNKYVEYDFTANLENKLDKISEGKIYWKDLLKDFWYDFMININKVKDLKISNVIDTLDTVLAEYLFPIKNNNKNPRECPLCKENSLKLKLGKFGAFIACNNYPRCKYTRQFYDNIEENNAFLNKKLGYDLQGNLIFIKKGPYSYYLQIEYNNKIIKRVSLPQKYKIETIDLKKALLLLSLPKEIGNHPQNNKKILTGIGKYGFYIKYMKSFIPIPKNICISEINLDMSLKIISNNENKSEN